MRLDSSQGREGGRERERGQGSSGSHTEPQITLFSFIQLGNLPISSLPLPCLGVDHQAGEVARGLDAGVVAVAADVIELVHVDAVAAVGDNVVQEPLGPPLQLGTAAQAARDQLTNAAPLLCGHLTVRIEGVGRSLSLLANDTRNQEQEGKRGKEGWVGWSKNKAAAAVNSQQQGQSAAVNCHRRSSSSQQSFNRQQQQEASPEPGRDRSFTPPGPKFQSDAPPSPRSPSSAARPSPERARTCRRPSLRGSSCPTGMTGETGEGRRRRRRVVLCSGWVQASRGWWSSRGS